MMPGGHHDVFDDAGSAWAPDKVTRKQIRLLLVDDDPLIGRSLSALLQAEEMVVHLATTGAAALQALSAGSFDVMLLDLRMPDVDGYAVLRALRGAPDSPEVIIHSSWLDLRTVTRVIREGAVDIVEKPSSIPELVERIQQAVAGASRRLSNGDDPRSSVGKLPCLIGQSEQMQHIRHQIQRVAAFPRVSVLIDGPTGTGKELVAASIHAASCPLEPFVTVNCAAIPEALLESELFGHVSGAFTGAKTARVGLLEEAGQGTLFLDEVGEMPRALQAKLLRVLESGEFRRVGSNKLLHHQARIVSATNRSLRPDVESSLRLDLYFRLAGYTLRTPALVARKEDIPALAAHFLFEFATRHQRPTQAISDEALRTLMDYDWPGNVRELRSTVENIAMTVLGPRIEQSDVEETLRTRRSTTQRPPKLASTPPASQQLAPMSGMRKTTPDPSASRSPSLPELEKAYILEVFESASGNVSEAARALGIARSTLRDRLRRYRATG